MKKALIAGLPSLIEGYAADTPGHFQLYFWSTGAHRRTSYPAAHR